MFGVLNSINVDANKSKKATLNIQTFWKISISSYWTVYWFWWMIGGGVGCASQSRRCVGIVPSRCVRCYVIATSNNGTFYLCVLGLFDSLFTPGSEFALSLHFKAISYTCHNAVSNNQFKSLTDQLICLCNGRPAPAVTFPKLIELCNKTCDP